MNLAELMSHLSVPRPNHSGALGETATYIKAALADAGVPFTSQPFPLHPYMQLILGIAVLVLAIALFASVVGKRPAAALAAALAIPVLLVVEFELFVPIVTGIVSKGGENIVVSFTAADPVRELIFAAHYDTKTDFWDHIQRARVYRFIPAAILLGLALAVFGFIAKKRIPPVKKRITAAANVLAGALVCFWALVFVGFGGYIFLSQDRQSFGAVDDGASVAALMALAGDMHAGRVNAGRSNVTIVFFAGEEVTMQGAHHYVRERFGRGRKPALPVSLINLELAGQNGPMVYWTRDGVFMKYFDPNPVLVRRISAAWKSVSGTAMEPRDSVGSDAQRFMAAGIPAVTVGNAGTPGPGEGGFHSPRDSMARVNMDNLVLVIKTLERYIEGYSGRL